MKATKGNKEYAIDESQVRGYQDAGYDIVQDGRVIAYGRGKTVAYDEYMALKEEMEALRAESGGDADREIAEILAAYALEHGISLGKASTVSGIMKKIREHQEAGAYV